MRYVFLPESDRGVRVMAESVATRSGGRASSVGGAYAAVSFARSPPAGP